MLTSAQAKEKCRKASSSGPNLLVYVSYNIPEGNYIGNYSGDSSGNYIGNYSGDYSQSVTLNVWLFTVKLS